MGVEHCREPAHFSPRQISLVEACKTNRYLYIASLLNAEVKFTEVEQQGLVLAKNDSALSLSPNRFSP